MRSQPHAASFGARRRKLHCATKCARKPKSAAMSADASQCKAFVESKWPVIQQTLEDYIRIPNQSPMYAPSVTSARLICIMVTRLRQVRSRLEDQWLRPEGGGALHPVGSRFVVSLHSFTDACGLLRLMPHCSMFSPTAGYPSPLSAAQAVPGLTCEVLQEPNRTPLIFIEVPSTGGEGGTVLM
jgi:hypothetical protein